ncbi:DUF6600 domain-containing protein [Pseudorhodoferax sp.]|uniref:DUF6600 domain-containing protein n=1 Tax=Pseudorhodoferax sp. TaxID=1993553 RepID=UPI002DD691D7|nr:DUF6600 domain-containing protein [Pseudorhodoferax sp.]
MTTRIWKFWAAAAALALLATGVPASAQQDPPARVARLSQPDAGVQWSGADGHWQAADANWPFTGGDRIRVAAGSRAELHAGAHALRIQGPAELSIDALDDDDLRLTLQQGSLNLRVRDMAPDERIELNTQNLALLVDRPGEFRIDAEPGSTRVAARTGTATLYGDNGESATLAPAQQARYVGRNLTAIAVEGAGPRDTLDQWAADRSLAEDQSASAQYLSREMLGYQELDAHGEWSSTAEYGTVWYPRTTIAGWAPYRHGQWRWVSPWGWTWFDDARWGFAPFHYGRWVQIGPRWAWVPGPRGPRPVYAPALVGFAGTLAPRPPGFGRYRTPGSDWVPLAPGQPWRPGFNANPRYEDRVNRGLPPPDPLRNSMRERPPGPIIATPAPGFQGGRAEQERRERWQREQEWQQQQRRQQLQDQSRNDMHQRHEQIRQEQLQRADQARRQQQAMQDQQQRQMQQLRQQQDQQQRQMQDQQQRQQQDAQRQQQDAQRQHERFMRDQQRDQMERRQDRPQPPRAAPSEDRRQPPGDRGGRVGNRD